jgi:hypothetical protein
MGIKQSALAALVAILSACYTVPQPSRPMPPGEKVIALSYIVDRYYDPSIGTCDRDLLWRQVTYELSPLQVDEGCRVEWTHFTGFSDPTVNRSRYPLFLPQMSDEQGVLRIRIDRFSRNLQASLLQRELFTTKGRLDAFHTVVLDFTNGYGGFLESVYSLLCFFSPRPDTKFMVLKDREGKIYEYGPQKPYNTWRCVNEKGILSEKRVIVALSAETISAHVMAARGLRSMGALLVGTPPDPKGLVQDWLPIKYEGHALYVSTMQALDPETLYETHGRRLQPHVWQVDDPLTPENEIVELAMALAAGEQTPQHAAMTLTGPAIVR